MEEKLYTKQDLINLVKFVKEDHTDRYGTLQVVDGDENGDDDEFATPKSIVDEFTS